jgi:hypothetical protein
MIRKFLDTEGASAHNRFQAWRARNQRAVFLTLETRTRANLHSARCQHLGSGPPYFLSDNGLNSLTSQQKVCGPDSELRAWATENGVTVKICKHCVRNGLVQAQDLTLPIPTVEPDGLDLSEELVGLEGAPLLKLILHRRRERKLREAKIAEALKRGPLRCEVPGCQFDFERTYGILGRRYAQVHHLLPLSDREEDTPTTLVELAVVCANCHVMIHRGGKNRQIDYLITNTASL